MTFDELYAECADSVHAYLRFRLRDVHLAEDIFQDTFLSAFRELTRHSQPVRPKAWILAIAHRRMVDRLRQTSPEETRLNEDRAAGREDGGDFAEAYALKELMSRLDEESRTILYALYTEGLTVRETAEMLNIPEGTVKSRGYAARRKLQLWMKEEVAP